MYSAYRHLLIMGMGLLSMTACDTPTEVAAAGAAPAFPTPIGPLPGPASYPTLEQTGLAQNPYADDVMALADGRDLFVSFNCAGCHGGHGGGGMGPSLRDVAWIYGSADAQVFSSIAEGRAHGMPSWARLVPSSEVWKLVAYIKSMRTDQEPHPPLP